MSTSRPLSTSTNFYPFVFISCCSLNQSVASAVQRVSASGFGPKSLPSPFLQYSVSILGYIFVSLPFKCAKLQQKGNDDGPDPLSYQAYPNKTRIFGNLQSWHLCQISSVYISFTFISHSNLLCADSSSEFRRMIKTASFFSRGHVWRQKHSF